MKKILLDEHLPHKLRHHLRGNVFTVAYMGWDGVKNGALLDAAEHAEFDVLVTGDQGLPGEQHIAGRKLAVVGLSAIEWPVIKPHIPKITIAIDFAKPGTVTYVDVGRFKRQRTSK